MNHQASRIPDIRQVREDLKLINEPLAPFESVFQSKGKDCSRTFRCVLLCKRMIRIAGQGRILDPAHLRVLLKVLRNLQGVFKVAVHSHPKRVDPLEKEKRVERAHARAKISQTLHSCTNDERNLAKRVPEPHAVVSPCGLGELLELSVIPWEVAAIHDNSADRRSVPAHEFR